MIKVGDVFEVIEGNGATPRSPVVTLMAHPGPGSIGLRLRDLVTVVEEISADGTVVFEAEDGRRCVLYNADYVCSYWFRQVSPLELLALAAE